MLRSGIGAVRILTVTEIDDPDAGSEAAEYIAMMAHELSVMAAQSDLGLLSYLLEMARDEARAAAQLGKVPGGGESPGWYEADDSQYAEGDD